MEDARAHGWKVVNRRVASTGSRYFKIRKSGGDIGRLEFTVRVADHGTDREAADISLRHDASRSEQDHSYDYYLSVLALGPAANDAD